MLHRLDKDTSGILLLARTRAAAAKYSQLFARKVNGAEKCYLALVTGVPDVEIGRIKGGLRKEWKGGVEKVVNVPDPQAGIRRL